MISIIIPNFNKGLYIRETLESILNQSFKKWEAIIVDDGSTDNSIDIIDSYCDIDNRFRLIERISLPKGGSSCRNIGLRHAVNEFVIFLDADDVLIDSCLNNRYYEFKKNYKNDFLVFSGGTFFKSIGDSDSQWVPPQGNHLRLFMTHSLPWNITSPIWRTEFLKKIGGFNITYPRLQDVELHTRALLQPNVQYKVLRGSPDFFYRIDESRKLKTPYSFAKNFVEAVGLYTIDIKKLIFGRTNQVSLLRCLNGTYIAAYLTVQTHYDYKLINVGQRNLLFNNINQLHPSTITFRIYLMGLKLNVHRIKGYNWIFRKMLTSIYLK